MVTADFNKDRHVENRDIYPTWQRFKLGTWNQSVVVCETKSDFKSVQKVQSLYRFVMARIFGGMRVRAINAPHAPQHQLNTNRAALARKYSEMGVVYKRAPKNCTGNILSMCNNQYDPHRQPRRPRPCPLQFLWTCGLGWAGPMQLIRPHARTQSI